MRVPQFLLDQQIDFETMLHPPSFSAQKLAKFLHISGRHVAKSVLLVSGTDFYLAVLPAALRVDLRAVSENLDRPVRLATEAELTARFNDCEYGAVTPFGHLYGMKTLLDDSIEPESTIVFEAERHMLAIRMTCSDFEKLENPRRFLFAVEIED